MFKKYLIYNRSYFTTNYKLIGIANSFSGGIFLCVALLHLLPESAEIFEEYFEHTESNEVHNDKHVHKHFPISFLLAFVGYTIILIIEKVMFDSHSHSNTEEEHVDNYEEKSLCEDKLMNESEIQQVNVNNNFNIMIPVLDVSKISSFRLRKNILLKI